jgi:hypothetical protein
MPIVQTLVTSFKKESWQGIHNLETDVLKIALYTGAVTLDANTTTYSTTNESSGAGYTAGGATLTGATINTSGTTVFVDFNNVVWSGASFTTRGALIYNSSKANRAIAVLDFGADKTAVGTFTVVMPANTVSTALLRFA